MAHIVHVSVCERLRRYVRVVVLNFNFVGVGDSKHLFHTNRSRVAQPAARPAKFEGFFLPIRGKKTKDVHPGRFDARVMKSPTELLLAGARNKKDCIQHHTVPNSNCANFGVRMGTGGLRYG